mmetsp:Transcript_1694/g.6764  ORF Transcript_1694/g.6764 Transcript_1694/m.6764 type:complete len:343 (+) Transcript_1694:4112-5140(+)
MLHVTGTCTAPSGDPATPSSPHTATVTLGGEAARVASGTAENSASPPLSSPSEPAVLSHQARVTTVVEASAPGPLAVPSAVATDTMLGSELVHLTTASSPTAGPTGSCTSTTAPGRLAPAAISPPAAKSVPGSTLASAPPGTAKVTVCPSVLLRAETTADSTTPCALPRPSRVSSTATVGTHCEACPVAVRTLESTSSLKVPPVLSPPWAELTAPSTTGSAPHARDSVMGASRAPDAAAPATVANREVGSRAALAEALATCDVVVSDSSDTAGDHSSASLDTAPDIMAAPAMFPKWPLRSRCTAATAVGAAVVAAGPRVDPSTVPTRTVMPHAVIPSSRAMA